MSGVNGAPTFHTDHMASHSFSEGADQSDHREAMIVNVTSVWNILPADSCKVHFGVLSVRLRPLLASQTTFAMTKTASTDQNTISMGDMYQSPRSQNHW